MADVELADEIEMPRDVEVARQEHLAHLREVGAHIRLGAAAEIDAFIVIVYRNRQGDLGLVLADDIFIEPGLDLSRLGELCRCVIL